MKVANLANIPDQEFALLRTELAELNTLRKMLAWAGNKDSYDFVGQIVSEVVPQDEYTHDIVVPFRNVFLVFDAT